MMMNNEVMLVSPTHVSSLNSQVAKTTEFEAVVWEVDSPRYYTQPLKSGGLMAIVPVHGYLAHRMDFHFNGYFTGYTFIEMAIAAALENPEVKGIVLDVNSGGGMVSGAFETAEFIRQAATVKPIVSIVDSSAYSAAYLLASQTDHIYVSKSGGVGSIGVVTMHVDMSDRLAEAGYKVEMLYKGTAKVDGNPYEALGEEARTRIMGRLEVSYNLFVDAVSVGRKIDIETVRGTEAGLFQGEQALSVQLVDTVMNPVDAYAVFAQQLSKVTTGGLNMTTEAQTPTDEATPVDSTVVAQEAKVSERQRIQAIQGSEEAKGRTDLASHLAYETEMSVEAAIAMLSKAPVDKPAEASNSFADAMSKGNPEIGDEANHAADEAVNPADSIMASLQAATGIKVK